VPLGARVNRWLESLTGQVERSAVLSSMGKTLTKPVAKVLAAGTVKDLLSGTWLGHPAHPLLTDIPIGAWTSAALLDLVELIGGSHGTTRRGSDTLVGIGVLAALPTAASGLSDLSDEVEDRMLAAGAAHAVSSLAATGLFAVSYLARRRGRRAQGMALSLIGTGVLTAAGLLGGHLSYRKGLGVDHNVFDEPIGDWTAALAADDLPSGKPQHVSVAGHDILLYRGNDTIYALANRCSHRGAPLHEGKVEDRHVICPWHSSRFDLRDGSITRGPAVAPQPCYETRVRDGKIEVRSKT
jgi:nitrite reductase/ring-hydroxylating ferredoxin subunit/uncharacterized membrane protein